MHGVLRSKVVFWRYFRVSDMCCPTGGLQCEPEVFWFYNKLLSALAIFCYRSILVMPIHPKNSVLGSYSGSSIRFSIKLVVVCLSAEIKSSCDGYFHNALCTVLRSIVTDATCCGVASTIGT